MDAAIKGYAVMLLTASAAGMILSVGLYLVLDDNYMREYAAMGAMLAGSVAGILAMLILRRRDVFYAPSENICIRLRDVSSIITFLSAVPTLVAIVSIIAFPEVDAYEYPLISAIMIFVSMLIQAFFWRKAVDVGYMSVVSNYIFCFGLILMNVSSLLAINHGGTVMLAVSILMSFAPALLMHDWELTADVSSIMVAAGAAVSTAVAVLEGDIQIGVILAFWIPVLIMLSMRNRLKGTFLVFDGERL